MNLLHQPVGMSNTNNVIYKLGLQCKVVFLNVLLVKYFERILKLIFVVYVLQNLCFPLPCQVFA